MFTPLFRADAINGSLYTRGSLDREHTAQYELTARVYASSGLPPSRHTSPLDRKTSLGAQGAPPGAQHGAPGVNLGDMWADTATVVVTVEDVNDNPPVILYPSPANNSVRLSLGAGEGGGGGSGGAGGVKDGVKFVAQVS